MMMSRVSSRCPATRRGARWEETALLRRCLFSLTSFLMVSNISAPCAAEMSPRPSHPQSPQSIQLVLKGNILFCDVMEGVSSPVFSIEHLAPAATRQPVRDLTLGSAQSYLSRVEKLKEKFRLKCNPH